MDDTVRIYSKERVLIAIYAIKQMFYFLSDDFQNSWSDVNMKKEKKNKVILQFKIWIKQDKQLRL